MKKKASQESPAMSHLAEKKKPVAGRIARKLRKIILVKVKQKQTRCEVLREDPPSVAGGVQIRAITNIQEPRGESIAFDKTYIPLDGKQRRARKGLLMQWVQTKDPFIAEALKRQEEIETPYREAVKGMYGKKGGWRESIILEAKYDAACRQELGQWLSRCAVSGESKELDAFSKAVESVIRADEVGPVNRKFLCGLQFVLRWHIETKSLPTQARVRGFLKKIGMLVDDRKNEARDLFKGPIMGNLPHGKAGRPRSKTGRA